MQNGYKTKSYFTPLKNRVSELDHQIDILNNLDLEGMETCSENNLSKTEQPEFSKCINPFMHNVVKWPNILDA